jgi:hypothetical protein
MHKRPKKELYSCATEAQNDNNMASLQVVKLEVVDKLVDSYFMHYIKPTYVALKDCFSSIY